MKLNRRELLAGIGGLSGTLILSGCLNPNKSSLQQNENTQAVEVTAVEDLMREHGVLRRALLVYSEAAVRLRKNPSQINPSALQKTARLFRTFGEDYHEKKLEEAYIFPAVKEAGGPAAKIPDILLAQHNRGRQITDYILSVSQGTNFESGSIEPLAQTLESLVRMYRAHAAREDTIIFPAWKQTLSTEEYDKIGDKFEEIEHQSFGEDGFEKAVMQISEIETELGLADLNLFTAPIPQSVKQ